MFNKIETERICSLYVNEVHLVVMLMPYIEKELEKNGKVVTILEDSLEEEVNMLLEKTSLEENKKEKIRKVNWNSKNLDDLEKLKDSLDNKVVIVKGSREYIERVNNILEKQKIKIINCICLDDFEKRAKEILKEHDKILNTLGEQEISEIFHINLKDKTRLLTK